MSSEDIRYARRSDVGEASASVELIGRLATVDWIELMVPLTESKSWYVRKSGLSVHHRCGCNLSASSIDAAMLIRLTLPPAKIELEIGNRSSETTWRAGLGHCSSWYVK
jgi:hypothetical protein